MVELYEILDCIFPIIQFTDEGSEPSYFNSASLNTQCLCLDQNVGLLTLSLNHSSLTTLFLIEMSVTTESRDYKN